MSIEQSLLSGIAFDESRLARFGFERVGQSWHLTRALSTPGYQAEIVVEKGTLTGEVLDMVVGAPFEPLRWPNATTQGGVVSRVYQAYEALLLAIKAQCAAGYAFKGEQTYRVLSQLKARYGEEPDFPFKDLTFGVLRQSGSTAWYALFFDVAPGKPFPNASDADSTETAPMVNVKVSPETRERLLEFSDVAPAWHMNKQHWVTLRFDASLSDAFILEAIEESRRLVGIKKTKSTRSKPIERTKPTKPTKTSPHHS